MASGQQRLPSASSPERRPALTVERIVDRAVQLVAAHGLAGLSMRRLADSLDVQAMSLYHHVANKAQLVGLMAQSSASKILAEDDDRVGLRWDERLLRLSMSIYRAGVDNPALIEVMVAAPLPTCAWTAGRTPARRPVENPVTGLLHRVRHFLELAPLPEPELTCTLHALISLLIGLVARAGSTRPVFPCHTEHARHALKRVASTCAFQ